MKARSYHDGADDGARRWWSTPVGQGMTRGLTTRVSIVEGQNVLSVFLGDGPKTHCSKNASDLSQVFCICCFAMLCDLFRRWCMSRNWTKTGTPKRRWNLAAVHGAGVFVASAIFWTRTVAGDVHWVTRKFGISFTPSPMTPLYCTHLYSTGSLDFVPDMIPFFFWAGAHVWT